MAETNFKNNAFRKVVTSRTPSSHVQNGSGFHRATPSRGKTAPMGITVPRLSPKKLQHNRQAKTPERQHGMPYASPHSTNVPMRCPRGRTAPPRPPRSSLGHELLPRTNLGALNANRGCLAAAVLGARAANPASPSGSGETESGAAARVSPPEPTTRESDAGA